MELRDLKWGWPHSWGDKNNPNQAEHVRNAENGYVLLVYRLSTPGCFQIYLANKDSDPSTPWHTNFVLDELELACWLVGCAPLPKCKFQDGFTTPEGNDGNGAEVSRAD
jgi:hypothetical protein